MKKIKKVFSLCLALAMLFTFVLPTNAMGDLAWDYVWESEDTAAGIIMFPGTDESERRFSWYTQASGTPEVEISNNLLMLGSKTFKGTQVKASEGDYANKVTVTDLETDTTYFYKCTIGEFTSNVYSFTTASETEFSAMYVTDVHVAENSENPENLSKTAQKFGNAVSDAFAKNSDISLILSAGDQASSGLESEYKAFTADPILKTVSIATTIGNHDRKGIEYKTFTNMPNEQTDAKVSSYIGNNYWFVKGDVLFLVVDSNNGSGTDHAAFVDAAVKANPDVKWKVMMAHHDLYSGRIPHRESENSLLRLIWSPIADEYGIDLVLLGHSHYYTVSNVMYNNKTVAPFANEMTDVNGTIYMVSCSINNPRDDDEIGLSENIGAEYLTENPTYNILNFTENSITVNSYEVGADEAFNSFTLTKTTNDGGHNTETSFFRSIINKIVRTLGTIYAVFNNIGVYSNLKESGFDVKLSDFIF